MLHYFIAQRLKKNRINRMIPYIKHAFLSLSNSTSFPNKQPLSFSVEDEKLKNKTIKGEWGVTIIIVTNSQPSPSSFSEIFNKTAKFIQNLDVYYSINKHILTYVNLFNTIIMDRGGVSYPLSSRETIVPIYQKIDKPLKFSVAFLQRDPTIKLPANSTSLLYTVLRGNIITEKW